MSTEPTKKTRQMPKGGRKGGSIFPRIALKEAVEYARKLVSKTHTAAQPADVIHSGVLGVKGGIAQVRTSALKQYGFLKGDMKSLFSADDLAKKITAAPADELPPLLQQAILKPTVFKRLFDTYHGDTVSKAKLKQRAGDLNVHPDETATCVDIYVSGMITAGLVTINGDQVRHLASSDIIPGALIESTDETESETGGDDSNDEKLNEPSLISEESNSPETNKQNGNNTTKSASPADALHSGPRAVFNVNVSLDSSLDIEKLQKQLELLKRFGAI